MLHSIDRRTTLEGLAALGLLSTAPIGLLAGCKQQKERMPLTIVSHASPQVVALQALMSEKQFFNEVGIEPTIVVPQAGTDVIDTLLGGTADICMFGAFNQLLAAMDKGADIKILGGTSIKGQQALFAKDPDIQYVKNLEGRSVGSGAIGTQSHHVIAALLRSKGVNIDKVNFVTLDNDGDAFRAVVDGTVDAGNGQTDALSSLDGAGVHMLKDGDYTFQLPEYTWLAAFATSKTMRDKRELLVRALAAYCKAFRYVQEPRSKNEFVKAYLTTTDNRDLRHSTDEAISRWNYLQERRIYAEDLFLSPARVQYMQELNIELGLQKKVLPYEQVIDTSLASEAVTQLK